MAHKIISRVVVPGTEVGTEMNRIIKEEKPEFVLVRWEIAPFWTYEAKADKILLVMEFKHYAE